MDSLNFVAVLGLSALACHTLAILVERRTRGERRKVRKARISTLKLVRGMEVDQLVIRELRGPRGTNG